MKIEINKTSYSLRFGMACIFTLGEMWKMDTFEDVMSKLVPAKSIKENKISFQYIKVICDLIHAAILSEPENPSINSGDLPDFLISNPDTMVKVIEEFSKTMPKLGKKNPPVM